jgi:CubicO group peptidase (beta-lactamase class C family)
MRIRFKSVTTFILIIILLSSLTFWGCKPLQQKIDSYLQAARDCWGFEGAALIAVDGKVIISKGYGQASQEIGEPNTPQTKFFIGSITKQFTAAAVLKLQEMKLLNIHDPIAKYLPDYPLPFGQQITIHQLLNHTSGIPDYTGNPEIWLGRIQPINPDQIIEWIKTQPLEFEPGAQFKYSNSGYILLGAIIERVSGQSYEAFLHQAIFKPCGMASTGYARREAGLPNRASGYTIQPQGAQIQAAPIHFSILHSAGALYSTVEDMLKWDQELYRDDILKQSFVDKMLTPDKGSYGYGWVIENRYGMRHVYHGGFLDGFNTIFDRWLDSHLCIVVFSNDDEAPVKKIARGLAAIIFDQPYTIPIKKQPVDLQGIDYAEYQGVYENDSGDYRFVALDNGRLYSQQEGELPRLILPEAIDTFFFAVDNTEALRFKRNDTGSITGCTFENDLGRIEYHKVSDKETPQFPGYYNEMQLDSIILAKYEGVYEIEPGILKSSPAIVLSVISNHNRLLAAFAGAEFMELRASSPTKFFQHMADFQLRFIVDDEGIATGCLIVMGDSQIRCRKIK